MKCVLDQLVIETKNASETLQMNIGLLWKPPDNQWVNLQTKPINLMWICGLRQPRTDKQTREKTGEFVKLNYLNSCVARKNKATWALSLQYPVP